MDLRPKMESRSKVFNFEFLQTN